jgi:hypothetical protein
MIIALAAAALALHGLIHLIGFVVPWGLAQVEGFPYRTTAFAGAIELGDMGARAVGVAWLLLAVGFVIAAVALWRRELWAVPVAVGLAIGSAVVCAAGLPEAAVGIAVDALVVALSIAGVVAARGRAGAGSPSSRPGAAGGPAPVAPRGEAL